eukprot:tig00000459_g1123.t1
MGLMLGRALATRLLDTDGVDPLPPSLVPLVPLLAGLEPAACTAAEALALWEPFLDPLAAEGKDTVIPMEGFLQGAPGVVEGDPDLDLTQENADRLIKRAAQWQCIDSRRPHIGAMREGFQSVFGGAAGGKRKGATQNSRNMCEALAQIDMPGPPAAGPESGGVELEERRQVFVNCMNMALAANSFELK